MSLILISHDKFPNQKDWGGDTTEAPVMDSEAKGVLCSSFVAGLQCPWHPQSDTMQVAIHFKNFFSLQQRWRVVRQEILFSTCWGSLWYAFSTNVWSDLWYTILHQERVEFTMNCWPLAAWGFRHKFCFHFLMSTTPTWCSVLNENWKPQWDAKLLHWESEKSSFSWVQRPFFNFFFVILFCESLTHFCVLMILVQILWFFFLLYSVSIFLLLCICCFLIFSFAAAAVTGREILERHVHTVLYWRYKDRGNIDTKKGIQCLLNPQTGRGNVNKVKREKFSFSGGGVLIK